MVEFQREKRLDPPEPQAGLRTVVCPAGPMVERRAQGLDRRILLAVAVAMQEIFPREKAVKGHPDGARPRLEIGRRRQGQVADRDDIPACRIAEAVELFDIADIEAGLVVHEGAERQVESAVLAGGERSRRQGIARPLGPGPAEHHGGAVLDRDDHGREFDSERHSCVMRSSKRATKATCASLAGSGVMSRP